MSITPDEALAETLAIRVQLDALDPSSPEYRKLELRRRELVQAAQEATYLARSPDSVRSEIAHLEQRLASFEDDKIDVPAWQTAMPTINDPTAHSSRLNEKMDANTQLDRDAIEQQIERLKKALNR